MLLLSKWLHVDVYDAPHPLGFGAEHRRAHLADRADRVQLALETLDPLVAIVSTSPTIECHQRCAHHRIGRSARGKHVIQMSSSSFCLSLYNAILFLVKTNVTGTASSEEEEDDGGSIEEPETSVAVNGTTPFINQAISQLQEMMEWTASVAHTHLFL